MSAISCFHADGTPLRQFYQWDINQTITISGATVSPLPQIHFCNQCSETALVVEPEVSGSNLTVEVPNVLLRESGHIVIFIYEQGSDDAHRTVTAIKVSVTPRPQPDGFIYSDNITYVDIKASMEEIEQARDEAVEATIRQPVISGEYWQIWDPDEGEYVTTSYKAIGTDGNKWFIGTAVHVSGGDPTVVPGSSEGDFYFNSNTAEIFELLGTGYWISRGFMPHSQSSGVKWFFGTSVSNFSGDTTAVSGASVGDCYFNTNTKDLFELQPSSTWVGKVHLGDDPSDSYQLIETINITTPTISITRTEEPDSTPYNFKKVLIHCKIQPYAVATSKNLIGRFVGRSGTDRPIQEINRGASDSQSSAVSYSEFLCDCSDGRMFVSGTVGGSLSASTTEATTVGGSGHDSCDRITIIMLSGAIQGSDEIPAGSVIKIYGVRGTAI